VPDPGDRAASGGSPVSNAGRRSCPGSADMLRSRVPLWRMCCGAAEKPWEIKAVAVLRLHRREGPSAKGWRSLVVTGGTSPADVRPAS